MFLYHSPIGTLEIKMLGSKVTGITLLKDEQAKFTPNDTPEAVWVRNWLDQYFQGKQPSHKDLPIMINGTPFQNYIWSFLPTIPYGQSMTYGQIAKIAAKHFGKEKMSAQAVGQAVSKNPLLIVIPCHRVMGANQKITGFSVGTDVKRRLLDLEGIPYTR